MITFVRFSKKEKAFLLCKVLISESGFLIFMIAFISSVDDPWTTEVPIPILSRKSGEDNLPSRIPIDTHALFPEEGALEITE